MIFHFVGCEWCSMGQTFHIICWMLPFDSWNTFVIWNRLILQQHQWATLLDFWILTQARLIFDPHSVFNAYRVILSSRDVGHELDFQGFWCTPLVFGIQQVVTMTQLKNQQFDALFISLGRHVLGEATIKLQQNTFVFISTHCLGHWNGQVQIYVYECCYYINFQSCHLCRLWHSCKMHGIKRKKSWMHCVHR